MSALSVTWWGHATTTITCAGVRVLTDPVLCKRMYHLNRIGGPVPPPEARLADVVVISHLHGDHLHIPSLRRLPGTPRLLAPTGTVALLRRTDPELAARVQEMEVGSSADVAGLRIEAVAAAHDGHRLPLSRHHGPALGYVLSGAGRRVWFAGDTGLFRAMAQIGPVDTAIVPVGGWGPTLGLHHLDPAGAAEAVRRVGAGDAVPIHYGTFWPFGLTHLRGFAELFGEPGRRFRDELAHQVPHATAHVLGPGATMVLP